MKDEMVSQEQQNRKHANMEMEPKVEADMVRRELQMKSSELVSASRALQEMKQRHVGAQDQANLLEQSYVQLRSEHQSSESMLAALQEEHQVQQRKLQKLAATTSTSSSDRAEVVAIGQRYSAALAHFGEMSRVTNNSDYIYIRLQDTAKSQAVPLMIAMVSKIFQSAVWISTWAFPVPQGYAELQSTHQKMKDEMMSQEHQNREYARVESEAKAQEDSVRKELQMKTSEVASANRALQEAKQQLVGTQDRADLLEQSYVQLRSEYQSSESMLAALQEEHQVQQRQLQKLAATTSTSSSDRAEVVAIGQRYSAALAHFGEMSRVTNNSGYIYIRLQDTAKSQAVPLMIAMVSKSFQSAVWISTWVFPVPQGYAELQSTHQKMKDEMMSQERQNREYARVESEAKAQEDSVRKELQMKTSEVASANRALQEAKQQLVGTQDRADLLEQSYVQLRSEHQSSESMLAALQEEHQVQQRQLQKLAATTSTSSSDRAEVVAIGQRYSDALAAFWRDVKGQWHQCLQVTAKSKAVLLMLAFVNIF